MSNKFSLGIAIAFVSATLFATKVSAQDAGAKAGLSISPPTFELSANPGDNLTNTIRVSNLSASPLHIMVDTRNFTAVGEDGAVDLTTNETPYSLASWITTSPTDTIIPVAGSKTFTIVTKVPNNAEPGGHFGSVVFRTIPDAANSGTGATLSQELGALFLLKVAGDVKNSATIASFAPIKTFVESGPIELDLRVVNGGSVHIKPAGSIVIADMFGHKVAVIPLEEKNILPGATRKTENFWNKKWLIGRYTATVAFTYDTTGTQKTATTMFTVFPVKIVLVVLVALLLLGYIVYRGRKRLGLVWRILVSGRT